MSSLLRFNLRYLRQAFGLSRLINVGAISDDALAWVGRSGFSDICMVVPDEGGDEVTDTMTPTPQAQVVRGDGVDFLRDRAGQPAVPSLYCLDGASLAAKMPARMPNTGEAEVAGLFPLLDALAGNDLGGSVLVIRRANLFFEGAFQAGEGAPSVRRWGDRAHLQRWLEHYQGTHGAYLLHDDAGYLVLAPKAVPLERNAWVNVLPGDPSVELRFVPGVPGGTATSIQRRLHDSRYATRYFVGHGLDVGGGGDSLALYQELFPRVEGVFTYDRPHGDAQLLANIPDDVFDFLFSSHCLEHMRDPAEALDNWLRVVRPGGYLVVSVPDEDLYEQGAWPSRFNTDHKITFTIAKSRSWSPVSVNVLDFLGAYRDRAEILSLQLMDQGYRRTSLPRGIDQTRTPLAECAIEFILRKRAA